MTNHETQGTAPPIPENPYRPSPSGAYSGTALQLAWDEGFVAGRAAATPDPPGGSRTAAADADIPVPLGTAVAVSLPEDVFRAAADEVESRFVEGGHG